MRDRPADRRSSPSSEHVHVVGRFPPPLDGQTLATERLASLLEEAFSVLRFNLEEPLDEPDRGPSALPRRALHFLRRRQALKHHVAQSAGAVVLWPSISPSPLGHIRDRLAVMPALPTESPVVAVVHRGDFPQLFTRAVTRRSAELVVERVSRFVFLTRDLSDQCARWIPESKRAVIPNTVDDAFVFTTEEIEAKQSARAERSHLRLLFVANMIGSKGYMDALDAATLLIDRGEDVEMHLAGRWTSADAEAQFNRRAAPYAGRIVHHGPVTSRKKLRRLYEASDVYILPTYYENEAQPLTILEALSAGTPVVTTRHAGIPEMVDEGESALFVPPRDPQAIAEAVRKLLDPPTWLAMARGARLQFLHRFSPESVGRQWIALIHDLKASK